jgi:Mce-associated membrane protein
MAKHADPARELNGATPTEVKAPLAEQDEPTESDVKQTPSHPVVENSDPPTQRDTEPTRRFTRLKSPTAVGVSFGVLVLIGLGSVTGWLGFQAYHAHAAQRHRDLLVATARQAAVNLTSIDVTEVERDIERVLESSTGTFHDDFQQRSEPFVDAVKQAQSKSVGTVTAAAIESQSGDQTQVLVGVSVQTTIPGTPEQHPRNWRLRISVQMVNDAAKVSDVQFVI